MDVSIGGSGNERPRPPSRRRRSLKRLSSISLLSPSEMILFRAPQPTYVVSSWPGELCVLGSSVCLALERPGGASRVVLFCHGTSSDIGMSRRSMELLRDGLESHIVAVEYPGYGLTTGDEPSEASVNAAVRTVYLHLTQSMGWPAERVIIMGRSLGSGPAAHLAREFEPGALFLLAPFTSVKDIAEGIVGETLASIFSLDLWNNKNEVAETASPTLLLHGLKDEVVPHTHSLELYRVSAASRKYVGLLGDSDHNRIDWHVLCDLYARPFADLACPPQRDRTLGIRPEDIAKLANFDPSSNGPLLVACAEAAWARRAQNGSVLQKEAERQAQEAQTRAKKTLTTAANDRRKHSSPVPTTPDGSSVNDGDRYGGSEIISGGLGGSRVNADMDECIGPEVDRRPAANEQGDAETGRDAIADGTAPTQDVARARGENAVVREGRWSRFAAWIFGRGSSERRSK